MLCWVSVPGRCGSRGGVSAQGGCVGRCGVVSVQDGRAGLVYEVCSRLEDAAALRSPKSPPSIVRTESCCVASSESAVIPAYLEDKRWGEVCIQKLILAF